MAESFSVTSGNVTESKDTDCGIIVSPEIQADLYLLV
jgi:hypothetical protein